MAEDLGFRGKTLRLKKKKKEVEDTIRYFKRQKSGELIGSVFKSKYENSAGCTKIHLTFAFIEVRVGAHSVLTSVT